MVQAVNRSEVLAAANPRIQFFHRARNAGILSAPFALDARVVDMTDGAETEVLAWTSQLANVLAAGRYFLVWTVDVAAQYGTFEVRWRYKTASTDQWVEVREPVEVVDSKILPATWRSLVTTQRLVELGAMVNASGGTRPSAADLLKYHRALDRVTERIHEYTRRSFVPKYETIYLDSEVDAPAVRTGRPIIALESLALADPNDTATTLAIDLTDVHAYNRHLDGLLEPDDRADPRVESQFFLPPGYRGNPDEHGLRAYVWPGGRMNVKLTGVWGYRDPDESSPYGKVPRGIEYACAALASRDATVLSDPDTMMSMLGRYVAPAFVGSV